MAMSRSVGLDRVDHLAVDATAAGRDRLQPGDHAQQGRLAAAGRADQHAQRLVGDGDRHALHGFDAAGIDFPDVLEIDGCHSISPFRRGRGRTSAASARRPGSAARWRASTVTITRCHCGVGIGKRDHLPERDDDGVHVVAVGDQQRPEILRPAVDEEDDEQRRDVGARQRQQDILEEAPRAGAVDARGLDQFAGDGQEELAEQEASRLPRRSAGRSGRHRCRSGRDRPSPCRSAGCGPRPAASG